MYWKYGLTKSVEQVFETFMWTGALLYEVNCHIILWMIYLDSAWELGDYVGKLYCILVQ